MTNEEIIENNKLIAEFLGSYELTEEGNIKYWYFKEEYSNLINDITLGSNWIAGDFKFNSSWNWLMPVVEKCTQIGFRDQDFDSEIYLKWEEIFDDTGMFVGNHIDEVYTSCLNFIKYLNDNKN